MNKWVKIRFILFTFLLGTSFSGPLVFAKSIEEVRKCRRIKCTECRGPENTTSKEYRKCGKCAVRCTNAEDEKFEEGKFEEQRKEYKKNFK